MWPVYFCADIFICGKHLVSGSRCGLRKIQPWQFQTWTNVWFKKYIWILKKKALRGLGNMQFRCKSGLFGYFFLLRFLNFLWICTSSAKVIHCFPSSGLPMHNQERSEKVHIHLQKRKQKEVFDCFPVHSYPWGHCYCSVPAALHS